MSFQLWCSVDQRWLNLTGGIIYSYVGRVNTVAVRPAPQTLRRVLPTTVFNGARLRQEIPGDFSHHVFIIVREASWWRSAGWLWNTEKSQQHYFPFESGLVCGCFLSRITPGAIINLPVSMILSVEFSDLLCGFVGIFHPLNYDIIWFLNIFIRICYLEQATAAKHLHRPCCSSRSRKSNSHSSFGAGASKQHRESCCDIYSLTSSFSVLQQCYKFSSTYRVPVVVALQRIWLNRHILWSFVSALISFICCFQISLYRWQAVEKSAYGALILYGNSIENPQKVDNNLSPTQW